MTPKQHFDAVFHQGERPSELLAMPLIMTRAARHIGVPYKRYVQEPAVMAAGQLSICQDFGMDVLATTSDPVSELASLGGSLVWFDDDPPAPDPLCPLIQDRGDLSKLVLPDPNGTNRMGDRMVAIREMKRIGEGKYPVLGWVEGPISEAAVMRGMTILMEDLIDDPDFVEELFAFNVEMAIAYAQAQVEAGADMIGFGDAPASLIGPRFYGDMVLRHEQRMVEEIKKMGVPVRMHICGNTTKILEQMGDSGADMIDIDSVADFALAAKLIPESIQLLGNLDPVREVLHANPRLISSRLTECARIAEGRYIVGAGCEVPAKTSDENFRAFGEFAHPGGWS